MILIIGAMDEEIEALKSLSRNPQEFVLEDVETVLCDLGEKKVLISKSGIGKVNAAYTVSTLCSRFPLSFLINIGSAGGLLEGQNIGDIVIADSCRFHDFDIGKETPGDPRFIFYPDSRISDRAEEILRDRGYSYHRGMVVTGDQFMQRDGFSFPHLTSWFPEAICAEMEAAAIACVCERRKVPFVILRGISDLIFREGNEVDFRRYLSVASKKSAEICRDLIAAADM